jgi:hypothetical protein
MFCKSCTRLMGAIEWILSAAIGHHCTDCGVRLDLFKEVG